MKFNFTGHIPLMLADFEGCLIDKMKMIRLFYIILHANVEGFELWGGSSDQLYGQLHWQHLRPWSKTLKTSYPRFIVALFIWTTHQVPRDGVGEQWSGKLVHWLQ